MDSNLIDRVDANLRQAGALLAALTGQGLANFDELADHTRHDYLDAIEGLVGEARELVVQQHHG